MSQTMQVIWSHIAFAGIWAVFAALFFALARRGYLEAKVVYPRFQYRIPGDIHMHISGVKFEVVINAFAQQFDEHVGRMNNSMRTAAKASLTANGISCGLALFGFLAEVYSWSAL